MEVTSLHKEPSVSPRAQAPPQGRRYRTGVWAAATPVSPASVFLPTPCMILPMPLGCWEHQECTWWPRSCTQPVPSKEASCAHHPQRWAPWKALRVLRHQGHVSGCLMRALFVRKVPSSHTEEETLQETEDLPTGHAHRQPLRWGFISSVRSQGV